MEPVSQKFSTENKYQYHKKIGYRQTLIHPCHHHCICHRHLNSQENLIHSSQHLNLRTEEMESEIFSSLLIPPHTLSCTFSFTSIHFQSHPPPSHLLPSSGTKTWPLLWMEVYYCMQLFVTHWNQTQRFIDTHILKKHHLNRNMRYQTNAFWYLIWVIISWE